MKKLNLSIILLLIITNLLSSCQKEPDLNVTVSADKTTALVGETITFTATISDGDYECFQWRYGESDGNSDNIQMEGSATTQTWTFTPSTKGTLQVTACACNRCDSRKPPFSVCDQITLTVN